MIRQNRAENNTMSATSLNMPSKIANPADVSVSRGTNSPTENGIRNVRYQKPEAGGSLYAIAQGKKNDGWKVSF
ncbi:MAG: hypothetical protein ABIJ16_07700 [Bacteroidota bacterium]